MGWGAEGDEVVMRGCNKIQNELKKEFISLPRQSIVSKDVLTGDAAFGTRLQRCQAYVYCTSNLVYLLYSVLPT